METCRQSNKINFVVEKTIFFSFFAFLCLLWALDFEFYFIFFVFGLDFGVVWISFNECCSLRKSVDGTRKKNNIVVNLLFKRINERYTLWLKMMERKQRWCYKQHAFDTISIKDFNAILYDDSTIVHTLI